MLKEARPDLALGSKLRKGSVKARVVIWPRHWPICWWFAGSHPSKAGWRGGGEGRGECLLLSSSFNCMTGHFLSCWTLITRGSCVDLGPSWRGKS